MNRRASRLATVSFGIPLTLLIAWLPGCQPTPTPVTGGRPQTFTSDTTLASLTTGSCLRLADFLNTIGGAIPPGERQGPVSDDETGERVGVIDIEFVAEDDPTYQSSDDPVPHVGIGNGTLAIDVSSLRLESGVAGAVAGMRIEPLSAIGISEANPLVIQAVNADGEVLDTQSLSELPNNSENPENPQGVDVAFELNEAVSEIRNVAPPGSFVTLIRVCLLDP